MINVCRQCGIYRPDKAIDPAGPAAICPECGFAHPFRRLPLLIVSGASGAGKTTVCHELTGRLDQAVLLDVDILWRAEFNRPDNGYRDFFETWLRMAKNIGQSGRPVVLFGAGIGVPENIEPCVERRYLSAVHYLALVCGDQELGARLKSRPAWRESGGEAFIDGQVRFNQWFKEQAERSQPPVRLVDTSARTAAETAQEVAHWITETLAGQG